MTNTKTSMFSRPATPANVKFSGKNLVNLNKICNSNIFPQEYKRPSYAQVVHMAVQHFLENVVEASEKKSKKRAAKA